MTATWWACVPLEVTAFLLGCALMAGIDLWRGGRQIRRNSETLRRALEARLIAWPAPPPSETSETPPPDAPATAGPSTSRRG